MRSSLAIATNGYFRLQPQNIAVEGYLLRLVSLGLKISFGDGRNFIEVKPDETFIQIRENGTLTNIENSGFAETAAGEADLDIPNGCKYV